MTKGANELLHKFPAMTDNELQLEAVTLNNKIVSIQRSKEHHKKRAELGEMQGRLHRMRMEIKRREDAAKRARWAVTPTATA